MRGWGGANVGAAVPLDRSNGFASRGCVHDFINRDPQISQESIDNLVGKRVALHVQPSRLLQSE